MRLFLCGPMSGLPNCNREAFHAAACRWRERGYEVLNPAELFDRDDLSHSTYLRATLAWLLTADMLVRLPGWENSTGAKAEVHVAAVLGLPMLDEKGDEYAVAWAGPDHYKLVGAHRADIWRW